MIGMEEEGMTTYSSYSFRHVKIWKFKPVIMLLSSAIPLPLPKNYTTGTDSCLMSVSTASDIFTWELIAKKENAAI